MEREGTPLAPLLDSAGAPTAKNAKRRESEDLGVEPEGLSADVLAIELDSVIEPDIAPPRDLPEAGHAGQDRQALEVPVLVLVDVERRRAWANEAHVPVDDIDQ